MLLFFINSETEIEEICIIIEKEENQPKKTPLILENLVQPLESKIKPYNIWKDLQIIIKEKISEEEEGSCSNPKETEEPKSRVKEIKEPIDPEKNNHTNNRTSKYGK